MHLKLEVRTETRHLCVELHCSPTHNNPYMVTFWDGDQYTAVLTYSNLQEAKDRYSAMVHEIHVSTGHEVWQAVRKRSA